MGTVFKITLSVTLGLITAGAVYMGPAMAGISFFYNKTTESLTTITKQSQDTQLKIEAERTKQRQLELQAEHERQTAAELQARLANEKEDAWKKFYTNPKECSDYSNNKVMIECGNHYIRTRKQFETDWQQRNTMGTEK